MGRDEDEEDEEDEDDNSTDDDYNKEKGLKRPTEDEDDNDDDNDDYDDDGIRAEAPKMKRPTHDAGPVGIDTPSEPPPPPPHDTCPPKLAQEPIIAPNIAKAKVSPAGSIQVFRAFERCALNSFSAVILILLVLLVLLMLLSSSSVSSSCILALSPGLHHASVAHFSWALNSFSSFVVVVVVVNAVVIRILLILLVLLMLLSSSSVSSSCILVLSPGHELGTSVGHFSCALQLRT